MEESLRQSELRFRTLVEHAGDAFFIIDRDGQIVDVNQRACDGLGYAREELIGMLLQDIQKTLTLEQIRQIHQHADVGVPVTSTGVHQRQDGSSFPVEVSTTSFEWGGSRLGLSLVRDITQRKQTEKALERLAEIGELAAMIVHEVRNPLTTVLMGLQSFQRMDLSARETARLELALEEGDRLQRLLSEILLYARRQTLHPSDINLNEFLADLLKTTGSSWSDIHVNVTFLPCNSPITVVGDRDKLKQVFINLLENAHDASSDGGVITCSVSQEPTHQQVQIKVHNSGEPIPEEILPNLTKPFFTTKSSGNGLGLAIVKRIVESHGGELKIDSSAECGTTVCVTLPVVASPVSSTA
jgi:PAS domain S-box-containing protein